MGNLIRDLIYIIEGKKDKKDKKEIEDGKN